MNGLTDPQDAWLADGQVCAMCAFDIAGFTRPGRDGDEELQSQLRHILYGIVREAFTASGAGWEQCVQQDRGDGLLVVLPPGIAPHVIIHPLPERLRHLIRRYNRFATRAAQMQVRAALNIGPVYRDENGYSGSDLNLVCRMLDAPPLRRLLAETGTALGVMVSDRVYDTIVARHPSLTGSASFRSVRTRVKRTRIDAWMYAPGTPMP